MGQPPGGQKTNTPNQDQSKRARRLVPFLTGLGLGLFFGVVLAATVKPQASVLESKLLDWPFLLLCVVLLVSVLFFTPLENLLGRGDILLSWGEGRSIRLRDLSKKLNQEFDPVRDDITELARRLDEIEESTRASSPHVSLSQVSRAGAKERILDALRSGKWRWRSIEALSSIAGISEEETLALLRADKDVVFGRGMSGRQIARYRLR